MDCGSKQHYSSDTSSCGSSRTNLFPVWVGLHGWIWQWIMSNITFILDHFMVSARCSRTPFYYLTSPSTCINNHYKQSPFANHIGYVVWVKNKPMLFEDSEIWHLIIGKVWSDLPQMTPGWRTRNFYLKSVTFYIMFWLISYTFERFSNLTIKNQRKFSLMNFLKTQVDHIHVILKGEFSPLKISKGVFGIRYQADLRRQRTGNYLDPP